MKWQPIEHAPRDGSRTMFVVRAFNVCNKHTCGRPYTSDPYCVWRQENGTFARWPHKFDPTHFTELPEAPE